MESKDTSTTAGSRPSSASRRSSGTSSGANLPGRPMGPERLLFITEKIYKSFNSAQITLDTHADNCVAEHRIQNSFDETFVRQVFYGVVRYRHFLACFLDSFYFYNGGVAAREDGDMYKISAYLAIFRLEELGFQSFRRLVVAKEPQKMVVFCRYLFDERRLRDNVRDEWLKLYDKEFVDNTIESLLLWKPEMTELVQWLEDKVYLNKKKAEEEEQKLSSSIGGQGGDVKVVLATDASKAAYRLPAPFNLSQPRPKPALVEDPPPPPVRIKPPPKIKEGPTKEEIAIQAAKDANRKALEAKYSSAGAFKLHTLERPSNMERVRAEVEANEAGLHTFQIPPPKPAPAPPTVPVKLNAAAILREDALYRKKQQEEAGTLEKYESELRDASTFKAWQAAMLEKDEEARAASVERKRQEMAASQEAAIRARERKVEDNLELGRQAKAEARRIEEDLAREREEDMRSKQAMRDTVVEARAAIGMAAEKVAIEKRLQAEEERKKQVAHAKALAEAEIREMAEKRDIIMQLRALEKAPKIKVSDFDPTTMPDHGLLETMSVMELRERLFVAKREQHEEEERQRSLILRRKQEKENMLMDKATNIQRVRMTASAQAHVRRARTHERRAMSAGRAGHRHEDDVLVLNSKLESKRHVAAVERARIVAEEKKVKFGQMQQAAGAAVVEETKFRELREGAKREATAREATKLAANLTQVATKQRSQSVRSHNVKAVLRDKKDFLAAYDEKLAQLNRAASHEASSDFARRTAIVMMQRDLELTSRVKVAEATYKPSSGKPPMGESIAEKLRRALDS